VQDARKKKERINKMKLNSQTLQRAAELAANIEAQQAELDQLLSGQMEVGSAIPSLTRMSTAARTGTGSRKFSPEAIEKIRAAQRRRWRNQRKVNAAAAQAAVLASPTQPEAAPEPAPEPAPAPVAEAPAPVQAAPAPQKGHSKKNHKVEAPVAVAA
jgi:hypothetical protein